MGRRHDGRLRDCWHWNEYWVAYTFLLPVSVLGVRAPALSILYALHEQHDFLHVATFSARVPNLWQMPDVREMNDTLPAAFAQVPMEVIYHMTTWARSLPTLEERGGAAQAVNYLIRMRDPNVARVVAAQAEKMAKRGKHG